jgi:hypothetical protein
MSSKNVFSEEKKQKTLTSLSRSSPAARAQETKFFSFFQERTSSLFPRKHRSLKRIATTAIASKAVIA